ncbi:MAG: aminotransferase class III-fold pyridoxal phosphate-dependent enzyme [Candidatus Omnitrophica bacterium]|nr:aminotransferase class III-fold pyridoxal phosphate-dependent enzyme [Candidatus Omnitrophota bacterium]
MNCSTEKSWQGYKATKEYLAQGSSTSSKVPVFEDSEPALIVKGKGCKVWDLDGNEYIDFRNALGPVTLGYAILEINQAITKQLNNGIIFGHPHPLEGETARLLVELIPCAERVRFLKTGGEAIAACIKIARNATRRNKVLHCGYNGWLNSLSGTGFGFRPAAIAASKPGNGVPQALQALHRSLPWGKIEAWEEVFTREGEDIAAVVIASDYTEMGKGKEFLPALRKLTKKYGSLMIIDEIVTGFRLALGGAHQYFDFQPDMAVFGKGMANGMRISAYLGRADLIDSAKEIGISTTFGGETLSLAAVKAVITFYKENNVIDHLWEMGKLFQDGVNAVFKKYKLKAVFKGFPVCPFFDFGDSDLKNGFFNTCYRNGISLYDVSYVNYSHKEKDIHEALRRIENGIYDLLI